jgi:hypothetical protein
MDAVIGFPDRILLKGSLPNPDFKQDLSESKTFVNELIRTSFLG